MPMVNGYQYARHMLELGSLLAGVEGPPDRTRSLLCVSTTEMNHIFRLLPGFAFPRDF